MMTSSNGNISRVTGHLCGESIGHRGFPLQSPVTQSFDVFFGVHMKNGWTNSGIAGELGPHVGHGTSV